MNLREALLETVAEHMRTYVQSHAFRQLVHEIVKDELIIYFRMDPSFQSMLADIAEDAGAEAAATVPYDELVINRLVSEISAFNNEATQIDHPDETPPRREFTTFLTHLVILLESAITARILNEQMPVLQRTANDPAK